MGQDKLNGSVDLLAKAMRQVFVEAVQEGTAPLRKDVEGLKEDVSNLKTDVDERPHAHRNRHGERVRRATAAQVGGSVCQPNSGR